MGSVPSKTLEEEHELFGTELINLGGVRVRVIRKGACEDSSVTLFFFHGLGGRGGQFKHQIQHFARHVPNTQCVSIDLPGSGMSPKELRHEEVYNTKNSLKLCMHLFERYRTNRNVLVGHSLGAVRVVQLYDRLVRRAGGDTIIGMILLAPTNEVRLPRTVPMLLAPHMPVGVLEMMRGAMRKSATQALFHPRTCRTQLALVDAEASATDKNPMFMMRAVLRDIKGGGPQALFEEAVANYYAAPDGKPGILVLVGEGDTLVPPSSSKSLKDRLGGSVVLQAVPAAGHNFMLEQPKHTNRLIEAWVNLLL